MTRDLDPRPTGRARDKGVRDLQLSPTVGGENTGGEGECGDSQSKPSPLCLKGGETGRVQKAGPRTQGPESRDAKAAQNPEPGRGSGSKGPHRSQEYIRHLIRLRNISAPRGAPGCSPSQRRADSTVSTPSTTARRQCRRPPPRIGFLTGQHTDQASLETGGPTPRVELPWLSTWARPAQRQYVRFFTAGQIPWSAQAGPTRGCTSCSTDSLDT